MSAARFSGDGCMFKKRRRKRDYPQLSLTRNKGRVNCLTSLSKGVADQ